MHTTSCGMGDFDEIVASQIRPDTLNKIGGRSDPVDIENKKSFYSCEMLGVTQSEILNVSPSAEQTASFSSSDWTLKPSFLINDRAK